MKFENITASTMNIKLISSFWYNEGYFLEKKKFGEIPCFTCKALNPPPLILDFLIRRFFSCF